MRNYRGQPSGTVSRARELRKNATPAEMQMWRMLRENFPEQKFRRQVPIGPYFADFFSFSAKRIIEVDGGQHGKEQEQDKQRTAFLESQGYHVIRFWNNEVLDNPEGVIHAIADCLTPSPSQA